MMKMLQLARNISMSLLLLGSASCSGGGGASPPVAPDSSLTVPLPTAFANIVNNGIGGAFRISGWVDNPASANPQPNTQVTGNGDLKLGAASADSFNGAAALGAVEVLTGSITANGQSTAIYNMTNIFYNPSNYTKAGTVEGNVTTVFSPYTIPATVKAGSTGLMGRTADGTLTESYTVASGDGASLLVTIIADTYDSFGHTGQTQTVYRVDTFGNVRLVSITSQKIASCCSTSPYQSMTFTFQ